MDSNDPSAASGGYVYLITHVNACGLHKIGMTRSPVERLKQLAIDGIDVTVIALVMSNDPKTLERDLHKQFSALRVPQSEWFNLKTDDVKAVCEQLIEAHNKAMKHVILPELNNPDQITRHPNDMIQQSWQSDEIRKAIQNPRDTTYRNMKSTGTMMNVDAFYWD